MIAISVEKLTFGFGTRVILENLNFSLDEGDRLGIGTNLYSDKMTVMEEMGKEEFMDEISKNSELYNKIILKIN